uniref:Uncharacterized protein n=1 Tax=Cannabis sativa TaxID=3483 RepID=A0A803QNM0_CANSA
MLDSGGGAFPDEQNKSASFIRTSISKEEVRVARDARLGSLSTNEIDMMVQELPKPGTIEIHDSESTVSAPKHLTHSRHVPDIEVKKMGEDWEVPDRESEEEENAEASETDSVDNAQLNEPFSCEALVSRVPKSNLHTFIRLNLLRLRTMAPSASQRPHLPFTNPAIIPTEDVVVSVPILCYRPVQHVLDLARKEIVEVLGSLSVQDRDWQLLCTNAKLREHKLIPEDASLHLEPVYKEPSKKQKERIDKRLSKQTSRPTSEMTFLKQAPLLNRKPKARTVTTSPIIPQKRKSEAVKTRVADSSKKQVKGTPPKKLMLRSTKLASQFIAMFSKAFVASTKEVDLLRKHNTLLQENVRKLKLDATSKEKDVKNLQKAKE